MRELHIGQTVVPYQIDWSDERATIGLSMDKKMGLTVTAPVSASLDDVDKVLEEKKPWILETLYGLSEQSDPPLDKEFLSGEKLLYNGRRYRLRVDVADVVEPELDFDGLEFALSVPNNDSDTRRKQQAVTDWYVNEAHRSLPDQAQQYQRKLGITEIEVEVRELARRWGEYNDDTIALNWRLVLAPRKIQDYVIAHELAHHDHPDHSDAFWNTVGTLVPDYRERREWLRVNGSTLTV